MKAKTSKKFDYCLNNNPSEISKITGNQNLISKQEMNKNYTLKIYYRTGDSNDSWDASEKLEFPMTLDEAKENIERIFDHYTIYQCKDKGYRNWEFSNYEIEKIISNYRQKYGKDFNNYSVGLVQNEMIIDISTQWEGYFEDLSAIEIILYSKENLEYDYLENKVMKNLLYYDQTT